MKAALHEIMYAETRAHARDAITRFAAEYGAKYPKAVTTLDKGADALLTLFDFPARRSGGDGSTAHTCCRSSEPTSASWTASSREGKVGKARANAA